MEIINSCSLSRTRIMRRCITMANYTGMRSARLREITASTSGWKSNLIKSVLDAVGIITKSGRHTPAASGFRVQIHRLVRSSQAYRTRRLSHIVLYISLDRVSRSPRRILTRKSKARSNFVFASRRVFDTRVSRRNSVKRRKVRRIRAKVCKKKSKTSHAVIIDCTL